MSSLPAVKMLDGTIEPYPTFVIGPGDNEHTGTIWTCSVCRRQGRWTDEHKWYGSILDTEPYKAMGGLDSRALPIVVTCSDGCREIGETQGLIPDDAPVFD